MGAHLEYGIGPDGRPVFASSMVGVDPRDRPRVTCPECDDVVTFKAGERAVVTPHVAHRSGAACAATAPETAAHFNAKMILARALGQRGAVRLRSRCSAGHAVEADWHVPAWERAVPEFKVDTRRPDVALFGEGGAVVGAVEVLHSHRVDRAKAADFAASALPWVEFRADDVLAWDGRSALPVEAADRETRRELAKACWACGASAHSGPPASSDEIAKTVAKFREAMAKLSALSQWESERRRRLDWIDSARQLEMLPPLHVAVACSVDGARVAAGAVCIRRGAKPNVAVIELDHEAGQGEAEWLSLQRAIELVETHARGPATVWVSSLALRDANCEPRPDAPVDATTRASLAAIDARRRTDCVVVFDLKDENVSAWRALLEAACREALSAPSNQKESEQ